MIFFINKLEMRIKETKDKLKEIFKLIATGNITNSLTAYQRGNTRLNFFLLTEYLRMIYENDLELNNDDLGYIDIIYEFIDEYKEFPEPRFLTMLYLFSEYCKHTQDRVYQHKMETIFEKLYKKYDKNTIMNAIKKFEKHGIWAK